MPRRYGQRSTTERGYGGAWRRLRRLVIARDGGICVACKAEGLIRPGNHVDHIQPTEQGGSDDMDNNNFYACLCL